MIGRRYIGVRASALPSALPMCSMKKYLNNSMWQQLKSITTLKGDIREKTLAELKSRGWTLQDKRDAVQKTYFFGDFAEVMKESYFI